MKTVAGRNRHTVSRFAMRTPSRDAPPFWLTPTPNRAVSPIPLLEYGIYPGAERRDARALPRLLQRTGGAWWRDQQTPTNGSDAAASALINSGTSCISRRCCETGAIETGNCTFGWNGRAATSARTDQRRSSKSSAS